MTNEKGSRVGGTVARASAQDAWALLGKDLSRRVPGFAAFMETPERGELDLTDAQQEFLDKFSSGLAEAISKEADGAEAKGGEDGGTA